MMTTRGRSRLHDRRLIGEVILSELDSGVQWRNLPKSFPSRSTVYTHFAQWRDDDTWPGVLDPLRDEARAAVGKAPTPTAAIIDSQTFKMTEKGLHWPDQGQSTRTPGSCGAVAAPAASEWAPEPAGWGGGQQRPCPVSSPEAVDCPLRGG